MTFWVAIVALAVIATQPTTPTGVLSRYLQAIGGEPAIRAARSRITEGEFDNGRGLKTRYRIIEESPNKRVTIIGAEAIDSAAGSGRGFDGAHGWDKSFIGTGLRVLEGRELAEAARDADMLRPLHLLDDCGSTSIESSNAHHVIVCGGKAGGVIRLSFDKSTGLLAMQDTEAGPRKVRIAYEDYRGVDGVTLPFKTRIEVAGATIKYDAASIAHNQTIDPAVFRQPK